LDVSKTNDLITPSLENILTQINRTSQIKNEYINSYNRLGVLCLLFEILNLRKAIIPVTVIGLIAVLGLDISEFIHYNIWLCLRFQLCLLSQLSSWLH
jgi:hypothetical protein